MHYLRPRLPYAPPRQPGTMYGRAGRTYRDLDEGIRGVRPGTTIGTWTRLDRLQDIHGAVLVMQYQRTTTTMNTTEYRRQYQRTTTTIPSGPTWFFYEFGMVDTAPVLDLNWRL